MALISKEELEEMYWGEPGTEMGCKIIAKEVGCHTSTIYRYLKKFGIQIRPSTREHTSESLTKKSREKISEKDISNWKNGVYGKKENHPAYNHKSKIKGENNPNVKLSKEEYIEIYYDCKNNNITITELSKKYNLNKQTISKIINAKHWATKNLSPIAVDYKGLYNQGTNHPRAKLSKEKALKIYSKYKNKKNTYRELASKYNVSRTTVQKIVNSKHWATKHLKDD